MNMPQNIILDGKIKGLTFDGIAGLFAGNESPYLPEYPPVCINQIFDLFYKPEFGISFHGIKIEVGGDGNSSCGAEPCVIRTREEYEDAITHIEDPNYEPNITRFKRGVTLWTAREAKNRNPNIDIDCLQWSAPSWVRGGVLDCCMTKENAAFYVAFIKGAKTYWDLDIDYIAGNMNEWCYDKQYVLELRKTLDKAGFSHIKIVLTDLYIDDPPGYSALEAYKDLDDPEFAAAVYAIGSHYWGYNYFSEASKKIRIWKGEDGFWQDPFRINPEGRPYGSIENALMTAFLLNNNYIQFKYTRDSICNPIISMANYIGASDGQSYIFAPEPWTGHYLLNPASWAIAHTTQFTKPGWLYLGDNEENGVTGCGALNGGGSYVAMVDPENGDYSIIMQTMTAAGEQRVTFNASNLSKAEKHVWETYGIHDDTWFRHISHIEGGDCFELTLKPDAIYTITTKPWGHKGILDFTQSECVNDPRQPGDINLNDVPASKPGFIFPYHEDFEDRKYINKKAKYFTDYDTAFEVVEGDNGPGARGTCCLEQQLKVQSISWGQESKYHGPAHDPLTYIGDMNWTDYRIKIDAKLIDPEGYLALYGRTASSRWGCTDEEWDRYTFKVYSDGTWSVRMDSKELTKGTLPEGFDINEWHTYILEMLGDVIKAYIDSETEPLTAVIDNTYRRGAAGIGSSFNIARFDNVSVEPLEGCAFPQPFISEIIINADTLTNGRDIKVGMRIVIGDGDITVYELGRYKAGENFSVHMLEIYDQVGNKLCATSVNMRTDALENGFIYSNLDTIGLGAPVKLSAGGTYYIVSTEKKSGDKWHEYTGIASHGNAAVATGAVTYDGEWRMLKEGPYCAGPVNFKCF